MTQQIKVGDLARDRISGYEGVVVAKTEWLNKCVRLTLQARSLKDGRPVESATFDDVDLVLVTTDIFGEGQKEYTGGPPTRGADPTR